VQNINIVYKVDKSEVDRSNAAVNQAKALTDQLKKSAQDYGTTAQKANQQASGSIEAVKVKLAQLRAQIELTNRSDTKRLNDLTKQYKEAKRQVDEFNKSLKEQQDISKKSAANVNSAAGAFGNLYSAIKLVIGAQVVRELVDVTLEAARLQGQVETVGNAFAKQIPRSESLLFRLRKATHGTVTDLELMQRALKFQNFGADVQQLPELLEFAAVRAQQTGESIDYMVNSIVDGIGRKSILKLDNLGISASRLKEEFNGAALASKSVAEVSQGVANIMREELVKMGGYAENAGTKVEQLSVAINDLKIAASQKFEGSQVVQFFNDVVNGATLAVKAFPNVFQWKNLIPGYNVITSIQEFRENLQKVVQTQEANRQALEEYTEFEREANKEREKALGLAQLQIVGNVERINKANQEIEAFKKRNELLKENAFENSAQIEQGELAIKHYGFQIEKYEKLNELLKEYILSILNANKAEKDRLVTIKTLRDELEKLKKQREEATSINNTPELDRLQREIILLEDRILKISDNIAWQKKWTNQSAIDTAKKWEETAAIEAQTKAIERLNNQFKIDTIGKGSITENIDIENEPEDDQTITLANEQWTRFRIAMKKAFGETKQDMNELFKGLKEEVVNTGIDITASLLDSALNLELANQEVRLQNLRSFYDKQQNLAGNNERVKKELALREQRDTLKIQKEMAEKQKRANLNGILINTAASVAKTAAQLGFPAAIPFIAIALATGATQYAIASKQPTGFKDGVIDLKGPGTATSDSIPASLSRGESVMTAKETKGSKKTLEMIRAKTLDDTVLSRLAARARGSDGVSAFDDSRMVDILSKVAKNTAQSDFIKKGSQLYEVKKDNDQYKKLIRSKYGL
jgi:hypothetical protein